MSRCGSSAGLSGLAGDTGDSPVDLLTEPVKKLLENCGGIFPGI